MMLNLVQRRLDRVRHLVDADSMLGRSTHVFSEAGSKECQLIFTTEGGELTEPAVVVPGRPPCSELAKTDGAGELAWRSCCGLSYSAGRHR